MICFRVIGNFYVNYAFAICFFIKLWIRREVGIDRLMDKEMEGW